RRQLFQTSQASLRLRQPVQSRQSPRLSTRINRRNPVNRLLKLHDSPLAPPLSPGSSLLTVYALPPLLDPQPLAAHDEVHFIGFFGDPLIDPAGEIPKGPDRRADRNKAQANLVGPHNDASPRRPHAPEQFSHFRDDSRSRHASAPRVAQPQGQAVQHNGAIPSTMYAHPSGHIERHLHRRP